MAIQDKRIDELAVASQIKETDLLVIEQNGVAKSVSGKVVNDFAADAAIRAGVALPTGGTVGQVLTKTATASEWADVDGLPDGGTVGQVLTKTASGASWQNTKTVLPSGGENGFVLAKLNDGAEWVEAGTPTQAQTDSAVADWLDAHPEATTTVQDGSIGYSKLDDDVRGKVSLEGFTTVQLRALKKLLQGIVYDTDVVSASDVSTSIDTLIGNRDIGQLSDIGREYNKSASVYSDDGQTSVYSGGNTTVFCESSPSSKESVYNIFAGTTYNRSCTMWCGFAKNDSNYILYNAVAINPNNSMPNGSEYKISVTVPVGCKLCLIVSGRGTFSYGGTMGIGYYHGNFEWLDVYKEVS